MQAQLMVSTISKVTNPSRSGHAEMQDERLAKPNIRDSRNCEQRFILCQTQFLTPLHIYSHPPLNAEEGIWVWLKTTLATANTVIAKPFLVLFSERAS